MDELYQVINILFRRVLSQWIINKDISYDKIPLNKIEQLLYAYEGNLLDETEIQRRLQSLKNEIDFQLYENRSDMEGSDEFNIYDLIDYFLYISHYKLKVLFMIEIFICLILLILVLIIRLYILFCSVFVYYNQHIRLNF